MAVVIVFVLIAAALAGLIYWSHAQQKQRQQEWTETEAALGLSQTPGRHSFRPIHARHHMPELRGVHDGQEVYVGVRTYTTGSGKNRQTHFRTFVDVIFDVPLKRGLACARAGGVSKFFGDIFGQADVQIGHADFDREFRVTGHDESQLRELLRGGEIIPLLMGDYGLFQPQVNDHRVRFEANGILTHVDRIRPLLGPAVALHQALLRAWHALPPSDTERRMDGALSSISRELELEYQARGSVVFGRHHEMPIRIEAALGREGWQTLIEAHFDPPFQSGLGLSREGLLSGVGKLFGSQDIQIGHAAFDEHFVVKGHDEQAIRQILTTEACDTLVALDRDCAQMVVDDRMISARFGQLIADPSVLRARVRQVVGAGAAMLAHRIPESRGPYRGR